MTYADHLRALIEEAQRAVPGLTYRGLASRASIGLGWVSEFMATGSGTFSRAEAVVAVIRDLCPTGESGDRLRRLLAQFDAETENERDAA